MCAAPAGTWVYFTGSALRLVQNVRMFNPVDRGALNATMLMFGKLGLFQQAGRIRSIGSVGVHESIHASDL